MWGPFALETNDPSLRAALVGEERAGLRFALRVRALALGVIAVWFLISVPMPRVLYWLGLAALFLVSGIIPYLLRKSRGWRVWFALFAAVDAAVLVTAMLQPNPLEPSGWPIQMGFRFHNVLYLFVLLAGAALSFSPILVIWTGFSAATAWSIGALMIAIRPETIVNNPAPTGDLELDRLLSLQNYLEPTYMSLQATQNEVVLLMVTAAIVAAAVWRARRLLLRQVESERARANLSRYVSPDLVDKLAQEQSPMATSDQRDVAVLFVDIIGFTGIAEDSTPERIIVMLRGFHRRMAGAVFACGGTVDKYAGDSVMATFGALGEGRDDACRALRCARAMLEAAEGWNVKRAARGAKPVKLGIGIHYGPVVVGNVGEQRHLQFTVIGDTVNVASRVERLTRDHGTPVLASADVIEAARREAGGSSDLLASFSEAGRFTVRGRRGEIGLWRLEPGQG
ncbi:MAG: adenylate/guanylate cyclase domain-containing protein [Kiloniellales bacterium]|nr:adenylate/guanylate cyclase domain-containing protein [Kiloniellales bacterium]